MGHSGIGFLTELGEKKDGGRLTEILLLNLKRFHLPVWAPESSLVVYSSFIALPEDAVLWKRFNEQQKQMRLLIQINILIVLAKLFSNESQLFQFLL